MNKTKIIFISTFLFIIAFLLILSFLYMKAKKNRLVFLYELGESTVRRIDQEPENATVELRFLKDDSQLIALLNNGNVVLWDLSKKTSSQITTTDGLFDFCPMQNLLITTKDKVVELMDIESGYEVAFNKGDYKYASIDKLCNTAAMSRADNEVEIWDIKSKTMKSKIQTTMPVRNGLAMSADGQKVAAAEGIYHEDKHRHETMIEVWDIASVAKEPVLVYDDRENRLTAGVWNLRFSSNGHRLGFDTHVNAESGVKLIDLHGNTLFEKSGFKSFWMRALDLYSDKNKLAMGDEEGNLVVWDVSSQGIGLYTKLPDTVESVSFSNDGSLIAAGSGDSTIHIFSILKH